jgi:HK97 family phage major capsid protein
MDNEIVKKVEELQAEFKKLLTDERAANEKKIEGKVPASDFTEFSKKIEARMVEINAEIAKLKVPSVHGDAKPELSGKAEYKKNFFNFLRTGVMQMGDKARDYFNLERKALVEDVTGQILVPEEVDAEIYRTLPLINVMRPLCSSRTVNRDRIRLRGITETQVGWGKLELGGAPVETTLVPLETWQYVEDLEGLTRLGKDELADSDVSLEPIVADSFARAMAEAEEDAFVNGLGHASQQPLGFNVAAAGVPTHPLAGANAIVMNDIMDLIYTVPAQYRRNGTFVMNSQIELALRILLDVPTGRYLWEPSIQAGKPNTLMGYGVVACDSMPTFTLPAPGTTMRVVAFGDFKSAYRIIDRVGMTIQRLNELYATSGLVGFLASRRVGGSVIMPNALAILIEP